MLPTARARGRWPAKAITSVFRKLRLDARHQLPPALAAEFVRPLAMRE
jgi:hypothetical protein